MKYLVTGTIKRDGKRLRLGSIVEFDAEDGDHLLAGGYVSAPPAADRAASKAGAGTGKTPAGAGEGKTPAGAKAS